MALVLWDLIFIEHKIKERHFLKEDVTIHGLTASHFQRSV